MKKPRSNSGLFSFFIKCLNFYLNIFVQELSKKMNSKIVKPFLLLSGILLIIGTGIGTSLPGVQHKKANMNDTKIHIEIWSDVVCPFCYIGKRKLENALEVFEHKELVEIHWKSFQLDPYYQYTPGVDLYDMLAEKKGNNRQWAVQMSEYVTKMAAEEGLKFDFDQVIPVNTLDAHRLIHLANTKGLQGEMKENLMAAYFTEGKNLQDKETLLKIGIETGLPENEVREVLNSNQFKEDVILDQEEARKLGIRGVPFFLIDNHEYISGAQPVSEFVKSLNKAFKNYKIRQTEQNPIEPGNDPLLCTPDNGCGPDTKK